jgi:xanthine dehydrogenase YagR molybdenum-binding subunit
MTFIDIAIANGSPIEAEGSNDPGLLETAKAMIGLKKYSSFTHSAVFAEVAVDENLGTVRVDRLMLAIDAGRILNPKTARSQIVGGAIWGMGMALHEESLLDHAYGRFMNHSFAEYHIPVNADVNDIDVIFVENPDTDLNKLGIKGLGEIGIVGTAAAIANAVFNATAKRVRDLPITLDKLI